MMNVCTTTTTTTTTTTVINFVREDWGKWVKKETGVDEPFRKDLID